MSGLLKGLTRTLAALDGLEPVDVEGVLIEVCRLHGMHAVRAESVRTRRGRDADRKRTSRGQRVDSGPSPAGFSAESASSLRGGVGGDLSDFSNSDPDLSVSLSGSSPKLSSLEGGPGERAKAEAVADAVMGAVVAEVLSGPLGQRLAEADRGSAPVASAPRRLNPAVLVDYFVEGVGGTWTAPFGMPFTALARALQAHVDQPRANGTALDVCRALGARWARYCAGAPEGPLRAIEWLGRGAPESPPVRGPAASQAPQRGATEPRACDRCRKPTTSGRVCSGCRQAVDREAEERESSAEAARHDGPVWAPPEVVAKLGDFFAPPPVAHSRPRALDDPEVQEQIRRLEREAG